MHRIAITEEVIILSKKTSSQMMCKNQKITKWNLIVFNGFIHSNQSRPSIGSLLSKWPVSSAIRINNDKLAI